jgi:hypothetical protein
LSNPAETINLARIAGPGIGPVAGRASAAFMRLQGRDAGPIFVLPIQPLGRTGSGDLESVAGNSAMVAFGTAPEDRQALSGFSLGISNA